MKTNDLAVRVRGKSFLRHCRGTWRQKAFADLCGRNVGRVNRTEACRTSLLSDGLLRLSNILKLLEFPRKNSWIHFADSTAGLGARICFPRTDCERRGSTDWRAKPLTLDTINLKKKTKFSATPLVNKIQKSTGFARHANYTKTTVAVLFIF